MAGNIRFLVGNLWPLATTVVTASSEAIALLAVASQNNQRTSLWQSDGTESEDWLEADFGEDKTFNALALANAVTTGTGFHAEYWDGADWADLGTLPPQNDESRMTRLFLDMNS